MEQKQNDLRLAMTERQIAERWRIERPVPGATPERQEVTFSKPWRVGEYEWRCAIGLPFMDHAPFEIPSNDPKHAEEQARWFAGELMEHNGRRRVDAD